MNPIKLTITHNEMVANAGNNGYLYIKMKEAGIPVGDMLFEDRQGGCALSGFGVVYGYLERENDISNGSIYYTWHPQEMVDKIEDSYKLGARMPTGMSREQKREFIIRFAHE